MFKTGIFHWYGYIEPFEERIKSISLADYDYVMLWWEDEIYPNFIDRRNLIKIVKEYGLKLDNVHLPFEETNTFWSDDLSKRNIQTNKIINCMHEIKNSGAETIVMHTVHGNNLKLNFKNGYDSFEKIIRTAEDIKLRVAFENTQMFEYTDFLLKELNSEYVGFCYDSSHDFVSGQSYGEILEKWKHKLFCVHLSDNDSTCDRHWIPGKGHVYWNKIIKILKQTNLNSFSMETYPYEEEKSLNPIEFITKARNNLISLIDNN
jgi:sugar phosphate isomerase/epimerase